MSVWVVGGLQCACALPVMDQAWAPHCWRQLPPNLLNSSSIDQLVVKNRLIRITRFPSRFLVSHPQLCGRGAPSDLTPSPSTGAMPLTSDSDCQELHRTFWGANSQRLFGYL
jgi:hypothetical protein